MPVAQRFKTTCRTRCVKPDSSRRCKARSARRGKHLDESLAVAERQGARFEHAQTLLARGRIGMEVDWPGAAEDVATARQALRSLGADFALDEAHAAENGAGQDGHAVSGRSFRQSA